MRTSSFAPGVPIRIDGHRFTLMQEYWIEGKPHWILTDENGAACHRSQADLEYLYDVTASLVFVQVEDTHSAPKKQRRTKPIADLPEEQRKRHIFRRRLIQEVHRQVDPGCTSQVHHYVERNGKKREPVTILEHICAEAARKVGLEIYGEERTCSVATYYRYCQLDPEELHGNFEDRGNRNQLDPRVMALMKRVIGELLEEAKYRKMRGKKPLITMREIMSRVLNGLKALRAQEVSSGVRSDAADSASEVPLNVAGSPSSARKDPLRLPSRATFYNVYNTFPAYNRAIARRGLTKARAMFRRPGEVAPVEAPLSCLQFDETRLKLFMVDEERQIPLGRPWLAFYVDEYSEAMPGFYCGFEPPGDLVIAATTRHACSMKGYVRDEYPDIDRPYLAGGIGRHFTYDNTLQAHGDSVAAMTLELDSEYSFTPSRSPWVKGLVERTFAIVNDTFLREMPGFVLPYRDQIDKHDYDPQKNAVVGFRHFLWLWHHWLLKIYHSIAPLTGIKMSRNDRWLEGISRVRPTFLDQSRDLNFLFGIERPGTWTLDHRGVVYEGLRYYSDDIDLLRFARGASQKARLKVNPLDLLWVHVWDARESMWIPAKAREAGYAKGLDLHRHKLIRRHAFRMSGRDNLEAWVEAYADLQHLIQSVVADSLSIGILTKMARAIGLDTAHMFRNMRHDGRLIVPPGSRPDAPLHPLRSGNEESGSSPVVEPFEEQRRSIPEFKADLRLGNLD